MKLNNQINFLESKPSTILELFLEDYSQLLQIDTHKAKDLIKQEYGFFNSKYVGGCNERCSKDLLKIQDPENRWYSAINDGRIDYSVYDQEYYFTDLWFCFAKFSRHYLKAISKKNSFNESMSVVELIGKVDSVVDLGCGLGLTSATIKQMFPAADVYATNLENTKQWKFCLQMAAEFDFKLVSDIATIDRQIDLVFASEYFEHIERPLEHLENIVSKLNPKHFIVASAFNTYSLGHFIDYKDGDIIINQKDANRAFDKKMKLLGYSKVKTKMWNQRPAIYSKV